MHNSVTTEASTAPPPSFTNTMKSQTLSCNPIATDELATVTPIAHTARLTSTRGPKAAAPIRIGIDPEGGDRTGRWEQRAFITLWLCGLFSVGYCLKTVLSSPWPR